eukprot:4978226-Pyramimonas_sp.AAC.1
MYNFDGISIDGHSWGEHLLTYEEECNHCEVRIHVTDERIRQLVLNVGLLSFDHRKQKTGYVLWSPVEELGLQKWDRLDPSDDLPDVALFASRELPFWCYFWRRHWDDRNRIADRVLKRNPIFSPSLGITPKDHLHADTLHVIYLGIMLRYCAAVIWSAIESNFWGIPGSKEAVVAAGIRRIFNDYKKWCELNNVALNMQLSCLTPTMLCTSSERMLKTKAAETGVLTKWAVDFCRSFGSRFQHGEALGAAGECLVEYMGILRKMPMEVPRAACISLLDLALKHTALMELAEEEFAPKMHVWIHMTLMIPRCGNPRMYSTFVDESLNAVLAGIAACAHRATWHRS